MSISDEEKQEWQKSYWATVLPFYQRIHEDASEAELWEMLWKERDRAQRDLFWLGKTVLGYDFSDAFYCPRHHEIQEPVEGHCYKCGLELAPYWTGDADSLYPRGSSPHRWMAEFFVKKNPDKSVLEQDDVHNRLLMSPRGSYKSSMDQADCVQWTICFPDIRILVLSATDKYSQDFVDAVKKHFVREEREVSKGKMEIVTLSWFQCLFIEHTVRESDKGASGEFTTHARTRNFKGIEPTLYAFGMQSTKSGFHFEIGKFDDCVSDANSGPTASDESRKVVAKTIRLARGLIMPSGYRDLLGTPYDITDAYSEMIESVEKNPEDFLYLWRPAWDERPDSLTTPEKDRTERDYDLFFPFDGKGEPQQTFRFLRGVKRESDHSGDNVFQNQYLCRAVSVKRIRFTNEMLDSHLVVPDQFHKFPQLYTSVAVWDLAYSKTRSNRRDFSVGSVGWFDPFSRLFVKEVRRGQWSKFDLADQIAIQAAKWRVSGIKVEGSNGAEWLETDIQRALMVHGYPECPIEFFPIDTTPGAKNLRAELLEGLFATNRLFFSSEIDIWDAVRNEFLKFLPEGSRHDDIIDSIAQLARFAPRAEELPKTEKETQQRVYSILQQKLAMERIFTQPDPPPPPPIEEIPMDHFDGYPIKGTDDWIFGVR